MLTYLKNHNTTVLLNNAKIISSFDAIYIIMIGIINVKYLIKICDVQLHEIHKLCIFKKFTLYMAQANRKLRYFWDLFKNFFGY